MLSSLQLTGLTSTAVSGGDDHLHHGYSKTPPRIAEGTLSPQRLRAVDVAEGDHH